MNDNEARFHMGPCSAAVTLNVITDDERGLSAAPQERLPYDIARTHPGPLPALRNSGGGFMQEPARTIPPTHIDAGFHNFRPWLVPVESLAK